jgi:hypothetical protein
LKTLEDKNRRQFIQLDHGVAPVPRKRVYRDIDTRLLRLKDHLQLSRKRCQPLVKNALVNICLTFVMSF